MPAEQQDPLDGLEACRLRFVDVACDEIEIPPDLDDEGLFLVRAVCVGRSLERMKDGELRRMAKMRVLSVEPQGPLAKPSNGPTLFSVGDDVDDGDGE